jgi:hypothetical protein
MSHAREYELNPANGRNSLVCGTLERQGEMSSGRGLIARVVVVVALAIGVIGFTAAPASAANSGCTVSTQIYNTTPLIMKYSATAAGCYTNVNKRLCVKLVHGVAGSTNTVSGPVCTGWSVSASSRATSIASYVCYGFSTYTAYGWTETNTGYDGHSRWSVTKTCLKP